MGFVAFWFRFCSCFWLIASCQLLAAKFSKIVTVHTPWGCFILPRFFVILTRELVHHHRSLSFATHCLNPGHVRMVESHPGGLLGFRLPPIFRHLFKKEQSRSSAWRPHE